MGLRIGDSLIITAPFEALAQISLDVKAWSAVPNTMMAAYSNGYMHYGAPASYYERGGYEVCECQLDAEWQQIYENCVKKIIAKLS
jgi:malate/lactate dehydrogenase